VSNRRLANTISTSLKPEYNHGSSPALRVSEHPYSLLPAGPDQVSSHIFSSSGGPISDVFPSQATFEPIAIQHSTDQMHTPIPENSRLHSGRSEQDAALSSGAENHRSNTENRRTGKASRRKPSVTDATLAPRQPRKARRKQATRGWMDETAAFLVHNQIRMSFLQPPSMISQQLTASCYRHVIGLDLDACCNICAFPPSSAGGAKVL
jgi:hypothetical protein